ncbi:MAG: DUF4178 domain-containing protein [Gemmatimonadaceae bacterium]|nr:DUF4178 domain-containing protein [Gemmatimonadaceae bacterium]
MSTSMAPQATGFTCQGCGASIEMHAQGWAVTVACGQCGALLDATDPNLALLRRGEAVERLPKIPIGTRGTWKGVRWDVIGFQRVEISVEGTAYSWDEYVCFNPYRGFFYLSEYEGHWNVIEKQHRRAEDETGGERPTATFDGLTFKHFQTASAYTTHALGEFPWELRYGDRIIARDFVAPPYILSAEASDNEVTWSLGTYTPPEVIAKAFGLKSLPSPRGVFANQPNPYTDLPKRMFGVFGIAMLVLIGMLVLNAAFASDRVVFNHTYEFARARPQLLAPEAAAGDNEPTGDAFVTEPFQLDGRPSSLAIALSAPLENDWMYVNLALINEATGETREAGRQISYYHGTDSDGSWSEGGRSETLRLSNVPAGRYFLRIQPEGGEPGRGPIPYRVEVRRDQPYYLLYGLAFLVLLVPTILALLPSAGFEGRRWAESDHAPASSGDSDDDE